MPDAKSLCRYAGWSLINYAYTKYEIELTYAEGDIVLIHGCLKISLTDGNTENPYGETTNWVMAPKFEKACYNELWDRYLNFTWL